MKNLKYEQWRLAPGVTTQGHVLLRALRMACKRLGTYNTHSCPPASYVKRSCKTRSSCQKCWIGFFLKEASKQERKAKKGKA